MAGAAEMLLRSDREKKTRHPVQPLTLQVSFLYELVVLLGLVIERDLVMVDAWLNIACLNKQINIEQRTLET